MSVEWQDVGQALLGSWPAQVASWSREAIAAYVGELQARGLSPERAVHAIRSHNGPFPPSAGEVAAGAVADPFAPTFVEMVHMLFAPHVGDGRGVFWTRVSGDGSRGRAMISRAYELHKLVGAFVESYGLARLQLLEIDHDEPAIRARVRRDLEEAWDGFVQARRGRELAQLSPGRVDGPRHLDAVRALGITPEADEREHSGCQRSP